MQRTRSSPPFLRRRRSFLHAFLHAAALVAAGFACADAMGAEEGARGIGAHVAALGDLDGDGKPEFATANRASVPNVTVVSTKTGRALWTLPGHCAAPIPDQDGDGKPDVVRGTFYGEKTAWFAICKGATGAQLKSVSPLGSKHKREGSSSPGFTDSIAAFGDVTGDGVTELLVVRAEFVMPGVDSATADARLRWCRDAKAYVVKLDGTVVSALTVRAETSFRTAIAAPAGDVGDDGHRDAFVSVSPDRGRLPLEVHSMKGDVVQEFKGKAYGSVASATVPIPDINGDDIPDYLLGFSIYGKGKLSLSGAVRATSGKNGKEIFAVKGRRGDDLLGAAIAVIDDLDGDGIADFVASAPGAAASKKAPSAGMVAAYSGKKGKSIWQSHGVDAYDHLGESLSVIADVDGDGVRDVIAGAPGVSPVAKGQVLVLSGKTGKTILTYAP